MAITQVHTTTIQNGSGAIVGTDRATVSGNTEVEFAIEGAASDDTDLAIAIDVSELEGFWIKTDKACTLKINDDGSPDKTITLVANQVYAWHNVAGGAANPLVAVDITKLTVTNGAGAVANVVGAFLLSI